jgi:hypothetical protein
MSSLSSLSNLNDSYRPMIAVDFDGTLCDAAYPGIGQIKRGAKEALTTFRTLGYKILIYSCRTCHWYYDVFGGSPLEPTLQREKVRDMIAFLELHDIPYDEIDDGSRGKPPADFYIDDKAIRYDDVWNTWNVIADIIKAKTLAAANWERKANG